MRGMQSYVAVVIIAVLILGVSVMLYIFFNKEINNFIFNVVGMFRSVLIR